MNKLLIYTYFMVFPLLSFCLNRANINSKNLYEISFVFFSFVLSLMIIKRNIIKLNYYNKNLSLFFIAIVIVSFLKTWYFDSSKTLTFFSLYELKIVLYIAFSVLYSLYLEKDDAGLIVKLIFVQAITIIFTNILGLIFDGLEHRNGLADESNYDCVILLLGFLMYNKMYGKFKLNFYNIVFVTAIIITQSKAGVISLISILSIITIRNLSVKRFAIYIGIIIMGCLWIYITRLSNVKNVQDVDRYLFLISFYETITDYSMHELALGKFFGEFVSTNTYYLDWFFKSDISLKGGIGLYPYAFHSLYLRLILSFGIIGFFIFMTFVWRLSVKSLGMLFFIIFAVFSSGMGFFYLTTVSVPVFIAMNNSFLFKDKNGFLYEN